MWRIQCHGSRAIRAATGRIQRHVIPEPRITLQGAATWWIHCHDSRATCHIAGCSHLAKSMSWSCYIAGCKNSIRHIENRFSPYFIFVLFLMQFGFWQAAAFVSSPIHLLCSSLILITNKQYKWQINSTDRIASVLAEVKYRTWCLLVTQTGSKEDDRKQRRRASNRRAAERYRQKQKASVDDFKAVSNSKVT